MNDIRPSYASGFARSAAESERPELWRGLAGAWVPNLGITGSMIPDLSGRGGIASYDAAAWATTPSGWAANLDGGSTHNINAGTRADIGALTTLSLAVRLRTTNSVQSGKGILSRYGANLGFVFWTYLGNIYWGIGANSVHCDWTNGLAEIADGSPHTLVATHGATGRRIYCDGVSKVTGGALAMSTAAYPLRIGAYGTGATSCFTGLIEAAWVWGRVISQQEIRDISADPLGMFRPRRRVYAVSSNRRRRLLLCGAV